MRLRTSNNTQTHSARIHKTTGNQAVTGAASITLDSLTFKVGTYVDTATANGLRATVAGLYRASAIVRIEGSSAGERAPQFVVNGTIIRQVGGSYSANSRIGIGEDLVLAANDLVTLGCQIAAATGLNAYGTGPTDGCALTLTYLGPA